MRLNYFSTALVRSFYNRADVISNSFGGLVAEAEQLSLVGLHGARFLFPLCASWILTIVAKILDLEIVLLRHSAGAVATRKAHY